MSKSKILTVTLLLVILSTTISCGKKGAGTYYKRGKPDEILQLKRNGTFYSKERMEFTNQFIEVTGTWRLEGNRLILSTPMGLATSGELRGDTLIDPDGKQWIKE